MIEFINTNVLPITIAIIMLGIGVNLKTTDFTSVFKRPKAVLTGLTLQLFLLPFIAFCLAFLIPMDPIQQMGLVLLATCPGGTSSNIVTFMLNGRVALSVSMTAFNSFLIVFTIPLYLSIASKLFLSDELQFVLSLWNTTNEIFWTVLFPVVIGMLLNHFSKNGLVRLKSVLRYLLPALLFAVFSYVLYKEQHTGESNLTDSLYLIFPALLLNILALFVGYYVSKFAGINHTGRFTIAIEMGLQNSALAIFIAVAVIQLEGLAIIPVLYGGFSFFTTLLIAYLMKRFLK